MGPNELHGNAHQGGDANGGLRIVGEDEEGAHGGDDTTVEHHADAHVGHGELCHTGLEEGAAEVAFLQGVGLLQEAVGLIGVGEVS